MSTLLDTNILTRLVTPGQPIHQMALDAVAALRLRNEPLRIVPQNLYEFWVVATRPATQNGLGLTGAQTDAEIGRFISWFAVLSDDPRILPQWRQLVVRHQVIGKNGHDARLVAAMIVHGIDRLLTFNKPDFARYQQIIVISPQDVVGSPSVP